MNNEISFIGIGNMGSPMARNLMQAGFRLTIFDKDQKKMKELEREGAKLASKITDAITQKCFIITMLPNDEALIDVMLGENKIAASLNQNHIHISMSTVSSQTLKEISQAHQNYGSGFIAAPVVGRPEAAAAKKLWIFLAGNNQIKNTARPILEHLGQGIYDFGEDITAANVIKLAINFLILSAIEAMGEAMAFIKKSNFDPTLFSDMICQTLFSCQAYQYHARNIATHNFSPAGFRLALGEKDITLLMQAAEKINVPMPLASLLYDRLISALAKKRDDLDWSAITLNCAEDAGLI